MPHVQIQSVDYLRFIFYISIRERDVVIKINYIDTKILYYIYM